MSKINDQKIEEIFKFLKTHHRFNHSIQVDEIKYTHLNGASIEDKAIRLLWNIYFTQSQPRLNHAKTFFEWIEKNRNCLGTFKGFRNLILQNGKDTIFEALHAFDGWGEKTSALFIKSLYLIQKNSNLYEGFWSDIDLSDERLMLPVDSVIKHIFKKINGIEMNFNSINNFLINRGYRSNEQMLIWDDLWFWGFITQNSQNGDRNIEWNEAKYWVIRESSKNPQDIEEIHNLAENFISILNK